MLNKYVRVDVVEAEPMYKETYDALKGNLSFISHNATPGFRVRNFDGTTSWVPDDAFWASHLPLPDNNVVTPDLVDSFVSRYDSFKSGEKTAVTVATLANGFEIVESSSCINPANYSQEIGSNICKERIKDKVWELLGFLFQTAVHGIKLLDK